MNIFVYRNHVDYYALSSILQAEKQIYSVYLYQVIVSHFSFEIMGIVIRFSCHALSEEVQTNRR